MKAPEKLPALCPLAKGPCAYCKTGSRAGVHLMRRQVLGLSVNETSRGEPYWYAVYQIEEHTPGSADLYSIRLEDGPAQYASANPRYWVIARAIVPLYAALLKQAQGGR